MYLAHYGLKEKPFEIKADPAYLWMGETYQEALSVLEYGILEERGFLLLTGDVGTGKTTLINTLILSLKEDVFPVRLTDPALTREELYYLLADGFGLKRKYGKKAVFLTAFSKILDVVQAKNKKILLIVDESQRLSHEILEEIRLLSNLEKQDRRFLNVFFVGQLEFNDFLWLPENRAMRQRITVNYHIEPLKRDEVRSYIECRLRVAGCDRILFSGKAFRGIHAFSGGFPRLINIICDHALLTGFVKGVTEIDHRLIRECAKELTIPQHIKERPNARSSSGGGLFSRFRSLFR